MNKKEWAAGIRNKWKAPDGTLVDTYSVITTESPSFILKTRHDRCPVFLKESAFTEWLSPSIKTYNELCDVLKEKEDIDFKVENLINKKNNLFKKSLIAN